MTRTNNYNIKDIRSMMEELDDIKYQKGSLDRLTPYEALVKLNNRDYENFRHVELWGGVIWFHTTVQKNERPEGAKDPIGRWPKADLVSFLNHWDNLQDFKKEKGEDPTITDEEKKKIAETVMDERQERKKRKDEEIIKEAKQLK